MQDMKMWWAQLPHIWSHSASSYFYLLLLYFVHFADSSFIIQNLIPRLPPTYYVILDLFLPLGDIVCHSVISNLIEFFFFIPTWWRWKGWWTHVLFFTVLYKHPFYLHLHMTTWSHNKRLVSADAINTQYGDSILVIYRSIYYNGVEEHFYGTGVLWCSGYYVPGNRVTVITDDFKFIEHDDHFK